MTDKMEPCAYAWDSNGAFGCAAFASQGERDAALICDLVSFLKNAGERSRADSFTSITDRVAWFNGLGAGARFSIGELEAFP